ncbi:threonylcarbamoyl-AMP synthase [Candidatus Micrarchaeota archaeon]|nr:threonylcarbamoyl-AMP synthase [Candidatus Micrarchaeota archaeon]
MDQKLNRLKITADLDENINYFIQSLKKGKVIIAPTETCYALVCDASNERAVDLIFKLKGRDATKGISIFCENDKMAAKYAVVGKTASKLINKYLPGPLTLILKKRSPFNLAKNLSKTNTIAIRISSNKFIAKLIKAYGKPLTATSANLSGKPEIYSGKEALKIFGNKKGVLIGDAGMIAKTPPTTIVDCSNYKIRILRVGKLKIRD